jgi:hypothetical protein
VIIFLTDSTPPTTAEKALNACFSSLAPQGELVVKLCTTDNTNTHTHTQSFKTQLLLAGFVNVEALPSSTSSTASLIAQKPKWEVGATASVSLPKAAINTHTHTQNTWKLTEVQDEEFVDQDALLEEDESLVGLCVCVCV